MDSSRFKHKKPTDTLQVIPKVDIKYCSDRNIPQIKVEIPDKESKYVQQWQKFKSWIVPDTNTGHFTCRFCPGKMLKGDIISLTDHMKSKEHITRSKSNCGNKMLKCRTCSMKCEESISVTEIDKSLNCDYATIVEDITGVKVFDEDIICGRCQCRALDAYKFRLQARNVDLHYFQQKNNEATYGEELENICVAIEYVKDHLDDSDGGTQMESELPDAKESYEEFESNTNIAQCAVCGEQFTSLNELGHHSCKDSGVTSISNDILQQKMPSAAVNQNSSPVKEEVPILKHGYKDEIELNSSQYECSMCDMKCKNSLSLLHHIRTGHLNSSRKAAEKTEKMKEKEKKVRRYMMRPVTPEPEPKFRCGVCARLFENNDQLDEHCRQHGETEALVCNLCERVYINYPYYKRHFKSHHPEMEDIIKAEDTMTIMELENQSVVEQLLSYLHMSTIGDVITATVAPQNEPVEIEAYVQTCGLCGTLLLSEEQLKIHNSTEHRDFVHRCYFCAKFFKVLESRNHHILQCRLLECTVMCMACDIKLESEHKLSTHMLRMHSKLYKDWSLKRSAEGKYVCQYCGRSQTSQRNLTMHYYNCGPQEECTCDYCGKTYNSKRRIERHIRLHTAEPHLCPTCGRQFNSKHHLKRHLASHTGLKPYECTLCPKSFTRYSTLSNHINIHNGILKYRCEICERKFGRYNCYRKHLMIHTGERPFRCNLCEAGFIQKHCLVSHMRKHDVYTTDQGLPLDPEPFKNIKKEFHSEEVSPHEIIVETALEDEFVPEVYSNRSQVKKHKKKSSFKRKHIDYEWGTKEKLGKSLPYLE